MRMNKPTRTSRPNTEPEPGHYGAGYGEQVPEGAPPQLGPSTDDDRPPGAASDDDGRGASEASSRQGEDAEPVVFTPADVHARPPDHTPTEAAPESEKVGLIFERS
jgi:hypothetical protein